MSNPFNILTEEVFVQKMSEKNALLREIATKIKEGNIVDEDFSLTSTHAISNKAMTEILFQSSPNLSASTDSAFVWDSGSATIALTRDGNGELSAESSDTNIVTAAISGNSLILTGGSTQGEATVTVTCDWDTGYKKETITIDVTNSAISTTLSDNSPAVIQAAVKSGQAPNLWSVGDKIGIALNGTVCSLSLNGIYYAFIIGFNHNSNREGMNTIDFQFGKTSSGTNIAFCDSSYNSTTSGNYFTMNTSATNSGGWKSSRMRTTILPAFKAIMPSEWQNVISARTMYTDNTGGTSNSSSNMTTTSDDIWLLSEYEVQGSRKYANSAESTYQKQYTYYANGNSKIFYRHSSTGTAVYWRLRSPRASDTTDFCKVYTDGSASHHRAYYSYGLAPGFRIS